MQNGTSLTTYTPNSEIVLHEEAEATRQDALLRQNEPVLTGIASQIQIAWTAALDAKMAVEARMLRAKRTLAGEYEPDKLAKIKEMGGSSIFMRLVDEKSAACKAWLVDMLCSSADEPWGVESTPVPDLTEEVKQGIRMFVEGRVQRDISMGIIPPGNVEQYIRLVEAEIQAEEKKEAKKFEASVEEEIKDVIVESNWREALKETIGDIVDYPAGFLKGPVLRQTKEITWGEGGEPSVQKRIKIDFECVSPFDMYPAPSSRGIDDGDFIQKHTLKRKTLVDMKGCEGYDDAAIDLVLESYGRGGLRKWLYEGGEHERQRLEGREQAYRDSSGDIDALQFWGSVQGMALVQHGMSKDKIPDLWAEYEIECWVIGSYIIKCVLNENPLGLRPYYKTSYRKRNGQFWGEGLPDIILDCGDMCNAAARAKVNNMGISSGPQIGVDTAALPPGEEVTGITPMKIWQFRMKDVQNTARAPIWFFQPKSLVHELIACYEFWSEKADQISGVPKYAYGQSGGGGAINTASGFSMMMTNTSRGIKMVVGNIDNDIVAKSIKATHNHLLLYSNNPVLRKGDVKLIAKGSTALITKEQNQLRRNELLQIVMNPGPLEIIGKDGLANILREIFKGVDLDMDVIPDKLEMMREEFTFNQSQAGVPEPEKGTQVDAAGAKAGGADARVV